ncbi:hypothetical protein [Kineococcus indalonis]|uniref:hypothetical protein n=1 Tax=Kineococcus indalonis TaxID=2696566 RepID=UPI0014123032|nr:hypothetical protein [Kineococcus indalonis]NAZ87309.1 hypothetical protein [Kineococcus indalonis]
MPNPTQDKLLEQLVNLTAAVQRLAEASSVPAVAVRDVSHAEAVRQRVAFGYRVLGTLTGRVSSPSGGEFDVLVVRTFRWRSLVVFPDLPPGARWVELRRGGKVEVLRVEEPDGRSAADDGKGALADPWSARPGWVRPRAFTDAEMIGSVVFLRTRRGPLIAFGPRLLPLPAGAGSAPEDLLATLGAAAPPDAGPPPGTDPAEPDAGSPAPAGTPTS